MNPTISILQCDSQRNKQLRNSKHELNRSLSIAGSRFSGERMQRVQKILGKLSLASQTDGKVKDT